MKSAYCAVRTGSLNKAVCASSIKGLMPSLHFCFVPGQTACRASLPLLHCPSSLLSFIRSALTAYFHQLLFKIRTPQSSV